MRTGGGGGLSSKQVDEELEQFAGGREHLDGRQSGSASLDVLSKDLKRGLQIFAGLIQTPSFEPARVDLASFRLSKEFAADKTTPALLSAASS